MEELTSLQRKHLRGLAQALDAVVIVGKQGVTENLVRAVDAALEAHELVKIRFNEFKDEKDANGQRFGMSHAKGAMGTVGANFNINERWFTRAEARYMQGKSDVTRAGQKVGEAQLDPWMVGVGVGARF